VHYIELREEAVKSWEHFISDKIVYAYQVSESLSDARSMVSSEGYLNGRFWIEMNFVLKGERHSIYNAITSCLANHIEGIIDPCEHGSHCGSVGGDSPVLVEVTYLVDPPQGVALKGVPSMVWLKRLNFMEGSLGHASDLLSKSFFGLGIPSLDDRELSPTGNSIEACQSPDGLVQCSPHTVNGITSDQANPGRDVMEFHCDDVLSMFYIILAGDGIGLRWRCGAERIKRSLQSIEVFLRPTNLAVRIGHAGHENSVSV